MGKRASRWQRRLFLDAAARRERPKLLCKSVSSFANKALGVSSAESCVVASSSGTMLRIVKEGVDPSRDRRRSTIHRERPSLAQLN